MMLGAAQSGWVSFGFGLLGALAALVVLVPIAVKVVRPVGRWVWRQIVNAVAERMLAHLEAIERKVTPNGGTEDDAVATRVVRLEAEVRALRERR